MNLKVTQINSENFEKTVIPVEFIVLHYTACSLEETLQIFCSRERKVCAHFVIDEVGLVYDLGKFLKGRILKGAHAGKSYFTLDQRRWENFNDFSIGIELVNFNGNLCSYPQAQVSSLISLVKHLLVRFPTLARPDRIVGHEQIAGFRGKVDPGRLFDWSLFFTGVFGEPHLAQGFPERVSLVDSQLWAEFENRYIQTNAGKALDQKKMSSHDWSQLSTQLEAYVAIKLKEGLMNKSIQSGIETRQNPGTDLQSIQRVHVIGVCGTLMGAFAAYLKRSGIQVTGSDQNIYPPMSDVLRAAGVQLLDGYRAENLKTLGGRPDLVVIGNVISANNPEARAAIDGGYSYSSLPEAMERLFLRETRNIVVAGTHGKTTTSSLLSHVLVCCQREPNYFIGGVSEDLPFSFQISNLGSGQLFVLEGDEYDTAFWDKVPKFNHYLPNDVILTSVEYDHADIYPDFAAVVRAFEGLISRIRPAGRLIACFDDPAVKDLVKRSAAEVISYGSSPETQARFTPGHIQIDRQGTRFAVFDQGSQVDELRLQLPGMHNILNALSVWIECRGLGLTSEEVGSALASFRGVKRRQEVKGEVGGVLVIDDFAHHPTAVRETLRALRLKYEGRRLVAVFEPRSATSRRKIFQKQYADAFQPADMIFIAQPYDQTRIAVEDQFSSHQLVDDLIQSGQRARLMSRGDPSVDEVAQTAQSNDLLVVLSNGGFDGFIPKILKALKDR